jgi:hypothetical protein
MLLKRADSDINTFFDNNLRGSIMKKDSKDVDFATQKMRVSFSNISGQQKKVDYKTNKCEIEEIKEQAEEEEEESPPLKGREKTPKNA